MPTRLFNVSLRRLHSTARRPTFQCFWRNAATHCIQHGDKILRLKLAEMYVAISSGNHCSIFYKSAVVPDWRRTFTLLLAGSADVGLDTNGEDIDGLAFKPR